MAVARQKLCELKWSLEDWDVSPITSHPPIPGLGEEKEVTFYLSLYFRKQRDFLPANDQDHSCQVSLKEGQKPRLAVAGPTQCRFLPIACGVPLLWCTLSQAGECP